MWVSVWSPLVCCPSVKGVARRDREDDPFAEGRVYPSTVDAVGPVQVTLDWKVFDGRIECVGIHITSEQPIPAGAVRDVKIGERIRKRRAEITARATKRATPGHGGMRRSTRARLEEAARIYQEAFVAGGKPAKAVAEHFGLTAGGASNLVARARAVGLLPPTSPGAPQA